MTLVPGYPAAVTMAGRSSATRSGRVSSSPAVLVVDRAGSAVKSSSPARGGWSRNGGPGVPGGADRQASESGFVDDLGDAGAVQRRLGAGQRLGDLIRRMPGPAQFDDLVPGCVLGRRPGRSGSGVEEEPGLAGPEIPCQ